MGDFGLVGRLLTGDGNWSSRVTAGDDRLMLVIVTGGNSNGW